MSLQWIPVSERLPPAYTPLRIKLKDTARIHERRFVRNGNDWWIPVGPRLQRSYYPGEVSHWAEIPTVPQSAFTAFSIAAVRTKYGPDVKLSLSCAQCGRPMAWGPAHQRCSSGCWINARDGIAPTLEHGYQAATIALAYKGL